MPPTDPNPTSVSEPKAQPLAAERQSLPVISPAPSHQPPDSPAAPDLGQVMHRSRADLPPAQRQLEALVVESLRTVYDPEIPINIYDLGLIYDIDVDQQMNVKVKMTLTSPACPVAGSLPNQVQRRVESIDQVRKADVELVWEPMWDKSRISESVLLELGLL